MNKKLKQVSTTQDYLMWCLILQLYRQVHMVITHMSNTTPYGDEYESACQEYKKLVNHIKRFESKIAECLERRNNNE